MRQLGVVFLALFCALLTSAGQIALKAGVDNPRLTHEIASGNALGFFVKALLVPSVLVGLLLYAMSAGLWMIVLTRADVSYAFPLVGTGFIFTAICASLFLHEPLSALRLAGIALITVGVALVARS
ncbi:MAG: EamA family transporter [Steroidobacteraceae bacterium]